MTKVSITKVHTDFYEAVAKAIGNLASHLKESFSRTDGIIAVWTSLQAIREV
jgi:predicted lipoprotein